MLAGVEAGADRVHAARRAVHDVQSLPGGRRKVAMPVQHGSLWRMNHPTREELLQRIWIDPARCGGKPCIRGHRIWVSLILDLLAAGESVPEILRNYPGLAEADILACIAYRSEEQTS